jgi:hypothetical protein
MMNDIVGTSMDKGAGPVVGAAPNSIANPALLELYLRTQDRAGVRGRFIMAAGLFVLTVEMAIGIFMAARIFWLPRL